VTWRLDASLPIAIERRFWRMLSPRWAHEPLSGAGAARLGGRWNEPGQAALYFSDSHATAIAEYQQDLPRPGTLTAYDVQAFGIVDLRDASVRQAIGIDADFLWQPWKHMRDIEARRPPGWDFAKAAHLAGWHGLRVPSVQAPGSNLVVWRWNEENTPQIKCFDPLGDLPRARPSRQP
jgi:RES domain-containing protein